LALVLAVAALAGLEGWWRSRGHGPSVEDDMALWAYHRERACRNGRKTIAVLGASEIQTAFSPEVFHRRFPDYTVDQLAVVGSTPMPTLWDLAQDNRFCGVVLCAMNDRRLMRPTKHGTQVEYVRYYHQQSTLNLRLNRLLTAFLEDKLVVLNPGLSLRSILHTYHQTGHLPTPLARTMRLDRSRQVDFDRVDKSVVRRTRSQQTRQTDEFLENWARTPEEWLQEALQIEPAVRAIQSRGGKVVFLRFSFGAENEALAERVLPRARYWDAFAARTAAVAIHDRDIPALAGLEAPDQTHLDYRDAPRFTEAVLDELVKRQVLDSAPDVHVTR